jgi:all-trans-8'-apo-beta-carotenal 15,15'-oxygenase
MAASPDAGVTTHRRYLRELAREHPFTPLAVHGRLPDDLAGILYRNGPARFSTGTRPHWFDGDGAVAAVRFADSGAQGAARLLHTPSLDGDAARARPRYGAFRQPISHAQRLRALAGGQAVRNVANINVLPWQGRLFALYEGTLPLEIDGDTLASLGETDLDGLVRGGWNAHPRRVASRHTVYQFGVRIARKVMLDVCALPSQGPARHLVSLPLPGVMELHDFFATDNHLVFALAPLWCSALEMLRVGSFVESLRWRPQEPTTLIVIPIDRPDRWQRIETEPFFFWHSVNAFERDGGRILVLDLVRYADFASTKEPLDRLSDGEPPPRPQGALWRGTIDLAGRTARWEPRYESPCEFGVVHRDVQGRPHRQAWLCAASGSEGLDAIACVTPEDGRARLLGLDAGCEVSEPAVVPRGAGGAEDNCYVLAQIADHRAGASFVGVWDGRRPEDGPLAKAWFDQLLPAPLHGCWVGAR